MNAPGKNTPTASQRQEPNALERLRRVGDLFDFDCRKESNSRTICAAIHKRPPKRARLLARIADSGNRRAAQRFAIDLARFGGNETAAIDAREAEQAAFYRDADVVRWLCIWSTPYSAVCCREWRARREPRIWRSGRRKAAPALVQRRKSRARECSSWARARSSKECAIFT